MLTLARDLLYNRAAKARGMFRPECVEELLPELGRHLQPGANTCAQLAVLELWLQVNGVR
jgi:asparagine synthase (glutamine-hydrolysing)